MGRESAKAWTTSEVVILTDMDRETSRLRNVGIVAHVDAGKTTVTEHMLYESGRIRTVGRVDDGTAHMDWMSIERERGISVRAATTVFQWKNCTINLIDTPGHVDFSAEVERALRVLDGAVLIISAVEGVQAHTETLWRGLQTLHIPTLLFINKMDRVGADAERVVAEIREFLTTDIAVIQAPLGAESDYRGTKNLWSIGDEAGLGISEQLTECIAERDEQVLDRFVLGRPLPVQFLQERLINLVYQGRIFPVLFGSAIRGLGVSELLDAVVSFLPAPPEPAGDRVSGVVFKIERDRNMGRVAYVRLYGGALHNRDSVRNATLDCEEKVTQIRKMHVQSYEDVGALTAGDIGAICGLSRVRIGDILGDPSAVPSGYCFATPLLTVQVFPKLEANYSRLVAALQELSDEDPVLDLQWLPEEHELHIKVMGTIQLEVLTSILNSRFGLGISFGSPAVIYKETPTRAGEGYVAYTMPKPCWAILRFRIEPGERGSGLVYSSQVRSEKLLLCYQNEVQRRVPEALQQGIHGWEVTDLKITLIEGEHHIYHTHPLDFVVATPMGIMDGLLRTDTALLEPLIAFRISVPEDVGGRVLSDLVQMRAQFESPHIGGGRFTVEGSVPVATSLDYPVRLGSLSGGRGTLTTRFLGYRECPPDVMVTRTRRGVNPLDQAKYILSVRNALSRE